MNIDNLKLKKKKSVNYNKKKSSSHIKINQLKASEYEWIKPLAKITKENAIVLGTYLAEVLAQIATNTSADFVDMATDKWFLIKNVAKFIVPSAENFVKGIENHFKSVESAIEELSEEILKDAEVTKEILIPMVEYIAEKIEENPQLIVFLNKPELLEGIFGELGGKFAGIINFIPAVSQKAYEAIPDLNEILFNSLFALTEKQRNSLYIYSEHILHATYNEYVFLELEKILAQDIRGKVLAPILKGAIIAIPGESCLNAALSIISTVRSQLTIGRVISIAIQKLGGLYVKISQVIAELCPPSLARELRTSQDDAGGLFPSIEQSWSHLIKILNSENLKDWCDYFEIPEKPQKHFASASVGALYELKLNKVGIQKYGIDTMLIKLQRPGLRELFRVQSNHLLQLCDNSQALLSEHNNGQELSKDTKAELFGIIAALRRAINNYYCQSASELNFNKEKENADRVRNALGNNEGIRIPKYYYTSEDIVLMERMPGNKITKIVQTKYLARKDIANSLIEVYLFLLFNHGVVWADPHPGNILFDDITKKVAMVDLNPCFVWTSAMREGFKQLIARLFLRDYEGIIAVLRGSYTEKQSNNESSLVQNTDAVNSDKFINDLEKFLNNSKLSGSLIRFVGEFIKTLNENGVELKDEVQAALRGLSQLALTSISVSARNSFGAILKRHFRYREILQTATKVGLIQVFKIIVGLLFEIMGNVPDEDVGPVLDERDIYILHKRVIELSKASVCNIIFDRVNPEDNINLRMSSDASILLVTSDLKIKILEKTKPATVQYVIEIPNKLWLKERQEFIKLASIARNFCIIESLEQLRRNSLDDYWNVVESWNKEREFRTVQETRLIGEVRTAARRLYALRFADIWGSSFVGLSIRSKFIWKFIITVETWREEAVQKYLISMSHKYAETTLLTNLAFSTFYRIKMLSVEVVLWVLRAKIRSMKYSMHLLPMDTKQLENMILFGLSRKYVTPNNK